MHERGAGSRGRYVLAVRRRYASLLNRLFPSLRGKPRGVRVAATVGLAVVVLAGLVVLPLLVALTSETGLGGALLALLVEAVGLGVLLNLYLVRRAVLTAGRVEEQALRVAMTTRRVAGAVDRVEARSRRQGARSVEMRKWLRDVDRAVRDPRPAQLLRKELAAMEARMQAGNEDVIHQNQALMNLFAMVRPTSAVPSLGGWAASPDLMLLLVDELLRVRPRTVVECGSGTSTLFMALAVAQHELPTRIVALEHSESYCAATRDLLARHGVSAFAEVRHAPLSATSIEGHRTPWYDEHALEGITDVGLMFVDGPPGSSGPRSRMPAVPLLRDQLAPVCTIFLDDLHRTDEQAVADEWAEMLPDFRRETLVLQKGAAVLRRG